MNPMKQPPCRPVTLFLHPEKSWWIRSRHHWFFHDLDDLLVRAKRRVAGWVGLLGLLG